MSKREITCFENDLKGRKDPVKYVRKDAHLGIETEYEWSEERDMADYYREFKDAKEAMDYIQDHPPKYTPANKKEMTRLLHAYTSHPEAKFEEHRIEKDVMEEINRQAAENNKGNSNHISYSVHSVEKIKDIPGEVMFNPMYYIDPQLQEIITKKSKTIHEVSLVFNPLLQFPRNKKPTLSGQEINIILEETGLFLESIQDTNENNNIILHCKMEELDDPEEKKSEQDKESRLPEYERHKAQQRRENEKILSRNAIGIPIIKEMVKEIDIDPGDPESIENYVQVDMLLNIILQEVEKKTINTKQTTLEGRFFKFLCYFYV